MGPNAWTGRWSAGGRFARSLEPSVGATDGSADVVEDAPDDLAIDGHAVAPACCEGRSLLVWQASELGKSQQPIRPCRPWLTLLALVLVVAAAAVLTLCAQPPLDGPEEVPSLSEDLVLLAEEQQDKWAALLAEQNARVAGIIQSTEHAKTPEEVTAILRSAEMATNPSNLTDCIKKGDDEGAAEILDAADMIANITNNTDVAVGRPNNLASCILNSILSVTSLAQAGVGIRNSVLFCNKSRPDFDQIPPGLCAASIVSVVNGFTWSGSMIAGAVSTCMDHPNLGANCAEDTLGLVASLGTAILSAAQLSFTCPPFSDNVTFTGRLTNGTDVFSCVVDSILAANALANAIQGILVAVQDCSRDFIRSNGLSPSGVTVANKYLCAADIVGIASMFQFMGGLIASAVDRCAPEDNFDALCASNIIELMASLTALTARALRMADDCNPKVLNTSWLNPVAR